MILVLRCSPETFRKETEEILGEAHIELLTPIYPIKKIDRISIKRRQINRRTISLRPTFKINMINKKSGNHLAVFDIYLPFVGVFNSIVFKWIWG